MMSITLQIPTTLRPDCGGAGELRLSAPTVRAALEQLEQSFPKLHRSVCDETGRVRPHINLFVNDYFVPRHDGLETSLKSGDILTIMPAVSGG